MKAAVALLFGFSLSACGPSQPIDTVESLSENPERLLEVQRRCKDGSIDVATCRAASEVVRRKFQDNGSPNYTPASQK